MNKLLTSHGVPGLTTTYAATIVKKNGIIPRLNTVTVGANGKFVWRVYGKSKWNNDVYFGHVSQRTVTFLEDMESEPAKLAGFLRWMKKP